MDIKVIDAVVTNSDAKRMNPDANSDDAENSFQCKMDNNISMLSLVDSEVLSLEDDLSSSED